MNPHRKLVTSLATLTGAALLLVTAGCSPNAAAAPTSSPTLAAASLASPTVVTSDQSGTVDAPSTPAPTRSAGTEPAPSKQVAPSPLPASSKKPAASAQTPTSDEGQPTAEIYAYLTAFNARTRIGTYDKVDAFFGKDAARACTEDGQTDTSNDRCTGYYYRNVNPRTRQIAVTPDATISILRGAQPAPGTATSLSAAVRESGGTQLFKIRVQDNQAVSLTAIYLP